MAPFGNKSTSSKVKSLLTVTIERVKILKNRTSIVAKQSREDVVKLLQKGQSDKALQRVDHVVREENMVAAYDLLITNCQIVIARSECIKAKDACHPDLREALATMIYAAPRCGELKELYEVRDILRTRYPNEFSNQVLDHKPEEKVNPQIIHNLSAKTPSQDIRIKLVKQIATEANIDWKYEAPPQRPRQNEEEKNKGARNATSDYQRPNPVTKVQDGAKVKNAEYDTTNRGSEEVIKRHEIKTEQRPQQVNSSISAPSRHVVQSAATPKKDVADYTRKDSENIISRHGVNMVQQSKHETFPISAPRNVQGTDTNSRRGLKDRHPVSSPDQSSTSCVDDRTEKTMRTPVHIDNSKVEVPENSTTRSSSKSNRNKKKADLEAVEAALQAASDAADAATYALEMVRTHSLKRREKMLSRKVSTLSGKSFSSNSGNDAVESPTSRSRFQDGQDTIEPPITRGRLQDDQFSKFSKNSRGTESPLKMRQANLHNSEIPKFDDYDSDESTARNFPIRQVKDKPQNHRQVFQKPTTNNLIAGKSIVSELSQDNSCFENDAESKFHGKKYVANNNTQREDFHQLSYQRSRTPSKVVKGTEYLEYSEEESPNQWSIKEDDMAKTTQYKIKSSYKTHVFSHRDEELNEVQQKFIHSNHTEGLDISKLVSKSTHRYKAERAGSEITRSSRGSNFDYSDEDESEFKLSFTKSREDKFATPASDYVKGTLMMNNYHESESNSISPDGKDNYRRPVNRKLQWQSLTSEELDVFNYDDDQPSVTGSTKADDHHPRFDTSPSRTAVRNPYEQNSEQNFSNKVFNHKVSAPLHQQQATVMEPHKLAVKSVRTRAPRRQIDQ